MWTLNPGFILVAAALFQLAAPKGLRAPTIAAAALLALWLMLGRDFGAAGTMAQMGLPVVLLNLDALNRIFGIAMLIAAVLIAMYSGARRNRYEDGAILLLAGGAISALFVGDVVSFVAAAELAALGGAGVVFASSTRGSEASGIRLLIWFGLEGLLFVVGAALHLSAGADSSVFTRLDVAHSIGDAFILAGLLIRVGAPFAHVWFKDAVRHASPVGAAALVAFSTTLGVYALARLFPAEPVLMPIGAAMIAIGLAFAIAEDDLRSAAAGGMSALTGVAVALIGFGSPLALAAAAAHMFSGIFVFVSLQMAFGAVIEVRGAARFSALDGVASQMPLTTILLVTSGLAAAAAPGTALFVTQAVVLSALARWETSWLWAACLAISPAFFITFALRPAFAALSAGERRGPRAAPFPVLLGTSVATFFCISTGVAPGWLYAFLPSEMAYQPLSGTQWALQLEILGAAGISYAVGRALGVAPKERAMLLWDLDAFYRGPLASLARWTGIIMLRVYGAAQGGVARLLEALAQASANTTQIFDRPYASGSFAWGHFAILALVVLITLIFGDLS